MLTYFIYLLTGALGGVVIGALGSGSSLIILPVLSLIFPLLFPATVSLQMATATSLATLMAGSFSGARSYFKAGYFDKKLIVPALPGVVAGAVIAPLIADLIDSQWLRWYIGVFIAAIGLFELFRTVAGRGGDQKTLNPVLIVFFSALCTSLSGIAGIALGVLMIPFLSRYTDHRTALGVNLILAVPYSVIGTVGYVASGLQRDLGGTPMTLGYIYLPAFLIMSSTMFLFPPLGLRLVKNIRTDIVKIIFYLYLLVIGITILL